MILAAAPRASLLAPFFEGLDMSQQTKKQVAFMAWAFGGPEGFKGRDLAVAHRDLVRSKGLGDVHFDAVAGHLDATLRELGVADALVQEALGIVATTRSAVLGR